MIFYYIYTSGSSGVPFKNTNKSALCIAFSILFFVKLVNGLENDFGFCNTIGLKVFFIVDDTNEEVDK